MTPSADGRHRALRHQRLHVHRWRRLHGVRARAPTCSSRATTCSRSPSTTSPPTRRWPTRPRDASSGRSAGPSSAHHRGPAAGRPRRVPGGRASARTRRQSDGDPGAQGDPRQAAGPPRRLPDEGRARRGAVRGQGAEPEEPRPAVLAEAGAERARAVPPDRAGDRPGRRRRVHAHRHRQRGAAPRGEPDQAPPAALQRPAQGRQELPVHQGHAGRRLPAHRADAQAAPGRQPLLRPVRVGERRSTSR